MRASRRCWGRQAELKPRLDNNAMAARDGHQTHSQMDAIKFFDGATLRHAVLSKCWGARFLRQTFADACDDLFAHPAIHRRAMGSRGPDKVNGHGCRKRTVGHMDTRSEGHGDAPRHSCHQSGSANHVIKPGRTGHEKRMVQCSSHRIQFKQVTRPPCATIGHRDVGGGAIFFQRQWL